MKTALVEVRRSFGPERLSRVAVARPGMAVGWIGGIRVYRGHTWELHPLVVRADRQPQGVGRAPVRAFQRQVARRGGTTIFLWTDDVDGPTSVAGGALYPDAVRHSTRSSNPRHR